MAFARGEILAQALTRKASCASGCATCIEPQWQAYPCESLIMSRVHSRRDRSRYPNWIKWFVLEGRQRRGSCSLLMLSVSVRLPSYRESKVLVANCQ